MSFTELDHVFSRLLARIEYLETLVDDLNRKTNNMFREAKVKKLYPDEGLVEVEGHGIETEKLPWLQRAGDINEWEPPTVDERVIIISPSGDITKSLVLPGGYSDKFPQPHKQGSEFFRHIKNANTSVLMKEGLIHFKAEKIVLEGNCYVGGEDGAKPASREGTVTTDGASDVSNFATKVWHK